MVFGSRFRYDWLALPPMPLYEYECSKGHRFEAMQKVNDKPLSSSLRPEGESITSFLEFRKRRSVFCQP